MSIFETLNGIMIKNLKKIDEEPTDGLAGTPNSLAYRVHEIEKHFHNSNKIYGNSGGFMQADLLTPFVVTGGDNAWGTELHIHAGDVIESGDTTKKFDLNNMDVTNVSAADKASIVEFLVGSAGADITGTVVESTEVYTRTGGDPMVANDDKVILITATGITGLSAAEVYYVTNVSGATFKLSRTIGGGSAALGGSNGNFTIKKLTQTSATKVLVNSASVNSDAIPYPVMFPRQTCNTRLFIRAKSVSGSTIGITFYLGLHVYTA